MVYIHIVPLHIYREGHSDGRCMHPVTLQAKPELVIKSAAMARGLFEVFLGEASVVTDARAAWVEGAKLLLESDTVKRDTR